MSIIIRLQNLPWTGSALDIRRFFRDLLIPDGGVHIIGGPKGEAFIAFATDEDARKAMMLDGQCIGDSSIKLFLSSKVEMQNSISMARGISAPRPSIGDAPFGAPVGMGSNVQMNSSFGDSSSGFNVNPSINMGGQGDFLGSQPINPGNSFRRSLGPYGDGLPNNMTRNPNTIFSSGRPDDWNHGDVDFPNDNKQWNQTQEYNYTPDLEYGEPRYGNNMDRTYSDYDDRKPFGGDSDFRSDFRAENKRRYDRELCVIVSNLPFSVSFKDVRSFFRGSEIPRDGLKLLNDSNGQRIGVAYIRFATPHDAKRALSKNGIFVGENRIVIESCSEDEFEDAIDSFIPGKSMDSYSGPPPSQPPPHFEPHRRRSNSPPRKRFANETSFCVAIKGFPLEVKKVEIRDYLKPLRLERNLDGIVLDVDRNGKRTNVVYVELEGRRDFQLSKQLNEKKFRGATIEVKPVPKSVFIDAVKKARAFEKDAARRKVEENREKLAAEFTDDNVDHSNGNNSFNDERIQTDITEGYCVKLDGLPYAATTFMVREFFNGLKMVNKGCHIMLNRDNQASGIGFVEFATNEDREQALEKNNSHMGHRYIKITPLSKEEMIEDIQRLKQTRHQSDTAELGKSRCMIAIDNLHFRASEGDVMEFFHQNNVHPVNVRIHFNNVGRTTGQATVAFHTPQECERVIRELNFKELMGRPLTLTPA